MFCIDGKAVDVGADNDGGLWYYDSKGNAATLDEERYKPVHCQEEDDDGMSDGK